MYLPCFCEVLSDFRLKATNAFPPELREQREGSTRLFLGKIPKRRDEYYRHVILRVISIATSETPVYTMLIYKTRSPYPSPHSPFLPAPPPPPPPVAVYNPYPSAHSPSTLTPARSPRPTRRYSASGLRCLGVTVAGKVRGVHLIMRTRCHTERSPTIRPI